eukprot:782467-Amphidinium_carterae.1
MPPSTYPLSRINKIPCVIEVTDHLGPSAPWRVEELGFTRPLVLRVAEGGLEANHAHDNLH